METLKRKDPRPIAEEAGLNPIAYQTAQADDEIIPPEHISVNSGDADLTGNWRDDLVMLAERSAPDVLADLPGMTLTECWGAYRHLLRRHREAA